MNVFGLLAVVVVSLNGLWDFRLEPDKTLEEVLAPGFVPDAKMTVPGAWDATSRYYNQSGTGCYRTRFDLKDAVTNAFLVIDGCCLRSRYWLDGREIGFSKLPWSRIEFATGPLAAGAHELVAAVDNVVDNSKVKLFWDFYDFYPSGGFQHGVSLELQEKEVEIRKVIVRTRDFRTGLVDLEAVYAQKGPSDFTANVTFNGGTAQAVAFKERHAQLCVPAFRLWTPETPNLHVVSVNGVCARFGIRQVGVADGRITLNGRPVYLKGINRHEAHYEFGGTTPVQVMYEDLCNLKDLGGNFIRGAHYAQCEHFLDLCDEMGVLVWEESLGWGNVARQILDPEFRSLQEDETRLMVRNSINHPSVVISAFLNEPDSFMPECKSLVERLIDVVKAEDSGHLVTFACHRTRNDISHEKTDIIAVNVYPGWYSHIPVAGTHDEMRRNLAACYDETIAYFRKKYGDDRPIVISESGVKSDYGARDPRAAVCAPGQAASPCGRQAVIPAQRPDRGRHDVGADDQLDRQLDHRRIGTASGKHNGSQCRFASQGLHTGFRGEIARSRNGRAVSQREDVSRSNAGRRIFCPPCGWSEARKRPSAARRR